MIFMTVMPSRIKNSRRFEKALLFIFLILLAGGLFLRLVPAITGNTYFGFDQGLDTILVKQLVVDHKINLVSRYSGLQGVLMGPLWTWFQAIPFLLSGGNPAAQSVFLSLFSLASSAATYWVLKKYLGPVIAIFAASWTLFAPIFVFNATVPASPHPLTFLFIFFLWFAYELFFQKKAVFWLPLLLLTGVLFQFEIGFALFLLPSIAILFLINKSWRKLSWHLPAGILLFSLTFLPQALFDLRHQFLITKGVLRLFSGGSNSLYGSHSSLPVRFGERAWSFGDDFLTMVLLFREWFIVIPMVLSMIWGTVLIIKQKAQPQLNFLILLAVIIGSFYVGYSFYPGPLWVWYRAGLPIVYTLLLVIPLEAIWKKYRLIRLPFVVLFVIMIIKAVNLPDVAAQLKGRANPDVANLKVQKMVLDYIYTNAGVRPFAYFAYTPPVYDYIWQYDFWWYGQKEYRRIPINWQMGVPLLGIGSQGTPPSAVQGLFYLIIEPNRERPWEPDGWKKSYIKVGRVLETKEFPGQVTVEKRTTDEKI